MLTQNCQNQSEMDWEHPGGFSTRKGEAYGRSVLSSHLQPERFYLRTRVYRCRLQAL